MGNISGKNYRENQNTHFVFSNFFFDNLAVYEKMWGNTVERGRPQMTIWLMRIACWIPKATNTHTGCVILIAFPLQQLLHEFASLLRHTYIACIVYILGVRWPCSGTGPSKVEAAILGPLYRHNSLTTSIFFFFSS